MSQLLKDAQTLDANDPLNHYQDLFAAPTTPMGMAGYFCGHSLGLMPTICKHEIDQVLNKWHSQGVTGHFSAPDPWLDYHQLLQADLGMLVGASAKAVVPMNSLTVNLHLLMASFYRPTKQRYKILIEADAFPSDRYAMASQLQWHGFDPDTDLIYFDSSSKEYSLNELQQILAKHGDSIAVAVLPGVQFLTGTVLDINALTAELHKHEIIVGWDLAHAVGNIKLDLEADQVDFAVWCSYKYLNSGPGAVAGAFVHPKYHEQDLPRLAGWWGHQQTTRFEMPEKFVPIVGAEAWQLSNPPILALAPLKASLRLFAAAGMAKLQHKSKLLTGFLRQALDEYLSGKIKVITPEQDQGAQLTLQLLDNNVSAKQLQQQLESKGFITDVRPPNLIRVAPIAFYNNFAGVAALVTALIG